MNLKDAIVELKKFQHFAASKSSSRAGDRYLQASGIVLAEVKRLLAEIERLQTQLNRGVAFARERVELQLEVERWRDTFQCDDPADAVTTTAIEEVELGRRMREINQLQVWRKCQEELLIAYRLGRRPSVKVLDTLAKLRAKEAAES